MTGPQAAARLLLVDDDEPACRLLSEVLERESYLVVRALSVPEALAALEQEGPFDAVLTDLRMPGASGLELLRHVRARDPDAIVLVLTAFGDATTAGEAIRAGAYDFISKPYDLAALRETLSRALGRRRQLAQHDSADATAIRLASGPAPDLLHPAPVGHTPAIIEVMKTIARVAPSHATVLIYGETGVGKEVVARTIHRFSDRASGRFVPINCSALAEGLLESELFGHVKGAFTGASASRPGLFREADHGTLFLDEIGDISPALQARLLRALQEHEVVPVGTETPVKVDVRVIAATHHDLGAMVRDRKFRDDLYYRLNVVSIHVPALRERRQDIPLLIDHFLRGLSARDHRGPVAIDPEAQAVLLAWDWPGNIRELQNVLERAVALAAQSVIGPEHLPDAISTGTRRDPPAASEAPSALLPLADVERQHVLHALASTGGNREAAARVLRISRRTLTRMLQRWGSGSKDSTG
jgi:DNA-binding NtrC family response regulator